MSYILLKKSTTGANLCPRRLIAWWRKAHKVGRTPWFCLLGAQTFASLSTTSKATLPRREIPPPGL